MTASLLGPFTWVKWESSVHICPFLNCFTILYQLLKVSIVCWDLIKWLWIMNEEGYSINEGNLWYYPIICLKKWENHSNLSWYWVLSLNCNRSPPVQIRVRSRYLCHTIFSVYYCSLTNKAAEWEEISLLKIWIYPSERLLAPRSHSLRESCKETSSFPIVNEGFL